MRLLICAGLWLLLLTAACQEEPPQSVQTPQPGQDSPDKAATPAPAAPPQEAAVAGQAAPAAEAAPAEQQEMEPPAPPVYENFQGEPQLSLFPRAGDYRPADDSDRLPYWNTFIDHLVRVTGVAEEQATGNRAWVFRSIDTIDSVGYFSPLNVAPGTAYQVSFTLAADLPEGATAGIGILEFDEFLWVPGQYTEDIFKQHFRRSHEGKRLTGKITGKHSFTFTTGPDTRMIHVVLFREGAHDRNVVRFDDIKVEEAGKK